MSTGYGEFTSRDGKRVYADASQMSGRISLCGEHDADVYFDLDHESADALLLALSLAYDHNGWLWHDPLGEESSRNSRLIGALRAALKDEPCWEDMAKAALNFSECYEE